MFLSFLTKHPRLAFLARIGRREIGLIAAMFIASGLVLGFGMLAEEVLEGDTERFDQRILAAFHAGGDPIGPPWVEELGRDVTALGSFVFLGLLSAAVVGYLLLIHKPGLAVLVVVSALGGTLLNNLLKVAFDRPRPEIESTARVFTASFPSGHATVSAIVFLTLGALLARGGARRRVKTYLVGLAIFLTVIVGLSRIYLGVHYPSDVLAGWCLGAAWAALCWAAAVWLRIGDPE